MDDLISRQAAIDALNHMCSEDENEITVSRANVNSMLKALPSAQPELARINDCNGCKFIGCYDTDFPCANCVRKDKDYYEPEG